MQSITEALSILVCAGLEPQRDVEVAFIEKVPSPGFETGRNCPGCLVRTHCLRVDGNLDSATVPSGQCEKTSAAGSVFGQPGKAVFGGAPVT